MFKYKLFISQVICSVILFFVSPLFASDVIQPQQDEHPISVSFLPQEEKSEGLTQTVSDYSYNELAVEAVKKNITLFTDKLREKFSLWLSRSGKYIELMKGILKEKGIPEEIVFLPLIESGFNPHAYSPARAVGYWQFISSTAKKYDLEINWWRDERKDFVKSTEAAADYLKDLYEMFGSWNLAMAAYNAGEGKITRALKRTQTDDYWELLNTKYIKRETKNYVPKFIAASLIANSPQEFGFEDLEYQPPLNYDTVTIESPIDLEVIASCAETSVDVIRELNPELRRWCTPPNVSEYILRIPEGKRDVFNENLSNVPEEKRFTVDIYKVKKGDTLSKITKKIRVPLQVIRDLNPDGKLKTIKVGMTLYLPPKEKCILDKDDRIEIKKASYKNKKKSIVRKSHKNLKKHKTGKTEAVKNI
jgi:membrane-bound lytic murein transglycosylase D